MAQRTRIGDIAELPTTKGLAYVQLTHQHDLMGGLIRVLDGVFHERPTDFSALVLRPHRFVTFFPFRYLAGKGRAVEIVAHEPVPKFAQPFPRFRSVGLPDPATGAVQKWSVWDGNCSGTSGPLTPELRRLPIREIINLPMLIQRIEEGWTLEQDDDQRARAASALPSDDHRMVLHYLYFSEQRDAEQVTEIIRGHGLDVDQSRSADEQSWLVLVRVHEEIDEHSVSSARAFLEQIADEHKGQYDGWEAEVQS